MTTLSPLNVRISGVGVQRIDALNWASTVVHHRPGQQVQSKRRKADADNDSIR